MKKSKVQDKLGRQRGRSKHHEREVKSDIVCRICHDEIDIEEDKTVVQPCSCNSWVHMECLQEWRKHQILTSQDCSRCEVCTNRYKMQLPPAVSRMTRLQLFLTSTYPFFTILCLIWVIFPNLWRLDSVFGFLFVPPSELFNKFFAFYIITLAVTMLLFGVTCAIPMYIVFWLEGYNRISLLFHSIAFIICMHFAGIIVIHTLIGLEFAPEHWTLQQFSWITYTWGIVFFIIVVSALALIYGIIRLTRITAAFCACELRSHDPPEV